MPTPERFRILTPHEGSSLQNKNIVKKEFLLKSEYCNYDYN